MTSKGLGLQFLNHAEQMINKKNNCKPQWSGACSTGQEFVSSEQTDSLQVALRASSLNLFQEDKNFLHHFRASAAATNAPATLLEIYHEPDAAFCQITKVSPDYC